MPSTPTPTHAIRTHTTARHDPLANLTPEQRAYAQTLADYFKLAPPTKQPTIQQFASRFYIPETQDPIVLMPHQAAILQYAFENPTMQFQTIVYSTIKKSGKTSIASLVGRWAAETWGRHQEVYCMANDLEQARGRIYDKVIKSIELDPNYNVVRRELPDKWKIIERQAVHIPTGSIVRAVSSDYKGEAGSNPSMTCWSELWGNTSEASRRLWEELTPVPTRARSIRFVETYAGFEDESDLLLELYKQGMDGRRLTHNDIYWPFEDQPPIWINERARMFMYWDSGAEARRMPWQTPDYYAVQESTLRPDTYRRLHLNEWTNSSNPFIPVEWWENCRLPSNIMHLPPGDKTAMVLACDAAVTSDCAALVGVTRHPDPARRETDVALRYYRKWTPPKGGAIDLGEIKAETERLCATYNVVQWPYDAYQLHSIATELTRDATVWAKSFSQGTTREVADHQLYCMIRDRRISHNAGDDFEEHVKNAASKQSLQEDTKQRIVKKHASKKIDLLVALSMAAYECLRLNLT